MPGPGPVGYAIGTSEDMMQRTLSRKTSQALLIFTRNPELGKCKTRLAASIGDQAALDVYRFLLSHTSQVVTPLEGVDKFVYFSEHTGDGTVWDPTLFHHRLQAGNDLGERMQHAFQEAFFHGYSRVVIIGSDLYNLTTEDLREAFRELERHAVTIGPAADGGYYLLGMRTPMPELFKNKKWGTASVLEDTLRDLKERSTYLLPIRNDVDRYEDIEGNPIFESIINASNE